MIKIHEEKIDLNRVRELYCDGGLMKKNPSSIGGSWAFCGVDSERKLLIAYADIVVCKESQIISNNTTETIAICKALELMPIGWDGTIISDSKVALTRTFSNPKFTGCPGNVRIRLKEAFNRLKVKNYIHVAGHPIITELKGEFGFDNETNLPLSRKLSDSGKQMPCSKHNAYVDALCNQVMKEYFEEREYNQS